MVTGFDIAAGISGLVTLADVVINRTYKTIKACRNAGKDSQRLLQEVQALLGILNGLKVLADETAKGILDSHIPAEEILRCQRTLIKARDKLVKASPDEPDISTATKWKRILRWPISSEETNEILEEINRHKMTFDLSVSVDTLQSILAASSEQTKIARGIEDVRKALRDITRIQLSDERRRVLDFFGTFDAEVAHGKNTELRQAGTGLWLTKGPEFENWLGTRNSKLWMFGIAGAGKTILAAAAIEEAIGFAAPEYGVVYYYCDYRTPKTQQLQSILAGLAGQLARQNEDCFLRLADLFRPDANQAPRQTLPGESELTELLQVMIHCFDEVGIIIDGIDECIHPDDVAIGLLNLTMQCAEVRMLIASRSEQTIRPHLQDFDHLSIAARNEDLKLYVSAEIQQRSQRGTLRIKSTALKDEIIERLINGAEGM